jgi:Pin2-interacting protein X1
LNSAPVPKLAISYKDDTLGLGASLKSQDPIHTRTGLDAFQGLLGRLNGKSDVELEKEVQKNEDRKLAMWAQGRWGGVMFVPGGTLVQGDGYKKAEEEGQEKFESQEASGSQIDAAESEDMAQRKAEKKRRKEEKRLKREAEPRAKAAVAASRISNLRAKEAEPQGGFSGSNPNAEKTSSKEKRKKKRESPAPSTEDSSRAATAKKEKEDSVTAMSSQGLTQPLTITSTSAALPRSGRHVIRGRNIEAKKMAFSDTKMLDQV